MGLTVEVMAESQVGLADQTVNGWHDVSLCEPCQSFHHHLHIVSPCITNKAMAPQISSLNITNHTTTVRHPRRRHVAAQVAEELTTACGWPSGRGINNGHIRYTSYGGMQNKGKKKNTTPHQQVNTKTTSSLILSPWVQAVLTIYGLHHCTYLVLSFLLIVPIYLF